MYTAESPIPPDPPSAQLETFVVGGKRVSLHTSVLEEKATGGCGVVCVWAWEGGGRALDPTPALLDPALLPMR